MDLNLKGKTALVTGASMGIGRAIAIELAREGVQVAITARRADALRQVATELRAVNGVEPVVLEGDLYESITPGRLAREAIDAMGRVDILINSAGGSRPVPWNAPLEAWDEGMKLNYTRLREITHELLPSMVEHRWGRVINMTGTSEPRAPNTAFPAKAAVHMWAKSISRDLIKHGVTINSIQPGRIMSEQIVRMFPTDESRREFCEREIPIGRFGEPNELADLAVFLCSPRAGYITGTAIPVDGGMYRFAF